MSPTNEPRTIARAMWVTRPARRQTGRKLAGVAEAIGRRYDIDPVLIRIAFVVTALYGPGIVLYLVAWAVLPVDPHDPPTGRLRGTTMVQPFLVLAAIVAGWLALVRGGANVVLSLGLAVLLLYLLHEHRGDRTTDPSDTDTATATDAATDAAEPGAVTGTTADRPVPTASPVAGVTGTGDTVSETPVPVPRPARRGAWLAPVTIVLALLALGITGGIVVGNHVASGPRLVAGVVLAVVALGMLVGAFLRRGRSLLLLAVPLVMLCYATVRLGPIDLHDSGVTRVAPTSVSQVAPSYEHGVGELTLDLRGLDLTGPAGPPGPTVPPGPTNPSGPTNPPGPTAPPGSPVVTRIDARAGEVSVVLPANADVTVRCHAGVGTLLCLTPRPLDGNALSSQVTDLGADGKAGGRPLDITITMGAGTVRVTRG